MTSFSLRILAMALLALSATAFANRVEDHRGPAPTTEEKQAGPRLELPREVVYGGKPAAFPEVVQMGSTINGKLQPTCSATIVSDNTIITAAHCLVGMTDFGMWVKDNAGQKRFVKGLDCKAHPKYAAESSDKLRKVADEAAAEVKSTFKKWKEKKGTRKAFEDALAAWEAARDKAERDNATDAPRDIGVCTFDGGGFKVRPACVESARKPGEMVFIGYGKVMTADGAENSPPDKGWPGLAQPRTQHSAKAAVRYGNVGVPLEKGRLFANWKPSAPGKTDGVGFGEGDSGGAMGTLGPGNFLNLHGVISDSLLENEFFDEATGTFVQRPLDTPIKDASVGVDLTSEEAREFLAAPGKLPTGAVINRCGMRAGL